MKQIITLFAFVIVMINANAQTCEIGSNENLNQTNMLFSSDTEEEQCLGGGDELPAIEIKIFGPVPEAETTEDMPWANTFITPSSNGDTSFDANDVVALNTNSSGGNMTICTKSSDGIFLEHNFIPNTEEIIIEVWASTIVPNSEIHGFQINIPEEYQNWCISYDQVGLGFEAENWIFAEDGEIFGLSFLDPLNINNLDQVFRLKFNPNPSINITASQEIIPWEPYQEPVEVTIYADGFNNENITWSWGENTISGQSEIVVLMNGNQSTNTTVYASVEGCGTTITDSVTIQLECLPIWMDFETLYFETTLPEDGLASIVINFEHGGLENIFWDFDEWGEMFGIWNGSLEINIPYAGTYDCSATAYNDCGDEFVVTFVIQINDIVSIEEQVHPTFTLFPNPNNGESLSIQTKDVGNATVEVFNSIGALVQQERVSSGETKELYFTQTLASGVYTVRLTSQNGVTAQQFVVR